MATISEGVGQFVNQQARALINAFGGSSIELGRYNEIPKKEFKNEKEKYLALLPWNSTGNGTWVIKLILIFFGFFNFVGLIGALLGYIYAYRKIYLPQRKDPSLEIMLHPTVFIPMIIGAFAGPAVLGMLIYIGASAVDVAFSSTLRDLRQLGFDVSGLVDLIVAITIIFKLLITLWFVSKFDNWRVRMYAFSSESVRHGTARFSEPYEVESYQRLSGDVYDLKIKEGLYIGNNYVYDKQGHILTVAGTRSGKGTNLIIPNLLGMGRYDGSWVVVDPKGENAAVTKNFQERYGRKVIILNPWNLLDMGNQCYNPLDLISDSLSETLGDDAKVIAEMIVPATSKRSDSAYWDDAARSLIQALLMHISTELDDRSRHSKFTDENITDLNLTTLWQLLRSDVDGWDNLFVMMKGSENPVSGHIISGYGKQFETLHDSSEKEWASILSTAQQHTDFIQSIALQRSLAKSDFEISDLTTGNAALYVVIPPDKLKSHFQWLRLVVTTLMRRIVNKPGGQVTFVLDEFYALGYLSEIETALGTYAGYNIRIWAILQSLAQLKALYKDNWENFLGNTNVRHFFGLGDIMTMEYVSKLLGETSMLNYQNTEFGRSAVGASSRPLMTPDELRRESEDYIITLIDRKPPIKLKKQPYWEIKEIKELAEPNPYFKDATPLKIA